MYHALPLAVREQARQAFRIFIENPGHPSLRFKKLNGPLGFWSVRFGNGYRAVCERNGDVVLWGWIGTHQAFDSLY